MKKSSINYNITFISHNEAAAVAKPGKCPFDLPSPFVSAQLSAIIIFLFFVVSPVWAYQFDIAPCQSFPQGVAVVSFVCNNPLRLLLGASTASARNSNSAQCRLKERSFVWARRVQVEPQRNSLAVDHHHPLRAFAPLGLSDTAAPFFAGAKLPSTNASLQSSCSRRSSSDTNARQALNQISLSSHSRSRRQQVEALGYSLGISDHGAPVLNIQRIPSNTSLLLALGRPPFLPTFGSGNSGASFAHRSSVNFHRVLAMRTPPFSWLLSHMFMYNNILKSKILRF